MRDITLVSAFYDIGRDTYLQSLSETKTRSTETYFDYFKKLANLDNHMIIFTSAEFAETIREIRVGKKTDVIVFDLFAEFETLEKSIEQVQQAETFKQKLNQKIRFNIEYVSPRYSLLTYCKPFFLNKAVEMGLVATPQVCWIDFGYVRHDSTIWEIKHWTPNFELGKCHLFGLSEFELDSVDIPYIVYTAYDFIIGGCIVVDASMSKTLWNTANKRLWDLIDMQLVDDEQSLLLYTAKKHPVLFKIHNLSGDWFSVIRRFHQSENL